MRGSVVGRQPLIELTFRFPGKPNVTIEFVIDTGFYGFLTLPPGAVAALQLPFLRPLHASLANDTAVPADVHEAAILWHGQETTVDVIALGRRPLLGTALLDG